MVVLILKGVREMTQSICNIKKEKKEDLTVEQRGLIFYSNFNTKLVDQDSRRWSQDLHLKKFRFSYLNDVFHNTSKKRTKNEVLGIGMEKEKGPRKQSRFDRDENTPLRLVRNKRRKIGQSKLRSIRKKNPNLIQMMKNQSQL